MLTLTCRLKKQPLSESPECEDRQDVKQVVYSHGIPHRIVLLSALLLNMAAIGMVQMLIEAAEYLERRERGKVLLFCLLQFVLFL